MDADYNELARRLFVLATEIIEAAHESAITGQRPDLATSEIVAGAHALCRRAEQLGAIARTILVSIEPETEAIDTDQPL